MTTILVVIANLKQLRTDGSFRILLPFFRTSWGVGVLNSAIFNIFQNRVEFGTILEGLRNFGGGFNPPPSVRHCNVHRPRLSAFTISACSAVTKETSKDFPQVAARFPNLYVAHESLRMKPM